MLFRSLRLLMVDGRGGSGGSFSAFRINVYNNTIADNISTHEGGGVAIDDATNVAFDNNTVVRNITTATAATSNGQPAPAGLSTAVNSALLQARFPASAPKFSKPVMFNNVFWDNRAGSYTPAGIQGIGLPGDSGQVRLWDFGIFGQPSAYLLHPTSTIYDSCSAAGSSCTSLDAASIDNPGAGGTSANVLTAAPLASNPLNFVNPFSVGIVIMPWRNQPQFIGNFIVAADLPPGVAGDYHVAAGTSPIVAAGRQQSGTGVTPIVSKPTQDIDDQNRPATGNVDAGSDQRVP